MSTSSTPVVVRLKRSMHAGYFDVGAAYNSLPENVRRFENWSNACTNAQTEALRLEGGNAKAPAFFLSNGAFARVEIGEQVVRALVNRGCVQVMAALTVDACEFVHSRTAENSAFADPIGLCAGSAAAGNAHSDQQPEQTTANMAARPANGRSVLLECEHAGGADDSADHLACLATPAARTASDTSVSGSGGGSSEGSSTSSRAPPAAVIEQQIDKIMAKLGDLDFRMDRVTGMYNAVALVRSGGECVSNFRRNRSGGVRRNQQTREQLIQSVMHEENLPRKRVWLAGTGGKPTQVCGAIACALAVWVRSELEAPIYSLVAHLARIRTGASAAADAASTVAAAPATAPTGAAAEGVQDEPTVAYTSRSEPAEAAKGSTQSQQTIPPQAGVSVLQSTASGSVARPRTVQACRFAGIRPVPGLLPRPQEMEVLHSPGVYMGVRGVCDVDSELHAHLKGGESGKSIESRDSEHFAESAGWCLTSAYAVRHARCSPKDAQKHVKQALARIPGALAVPGTQREEFLVPLNILSERVDDPEAAELIRTRVEDVAERVDQLFRRTVKVDSLVRSGPPEGTIPDPPRASETEPVIETNGARFELQVAAVQAIARIAGAALPQAQTTGKPRHHDMGAVADSTSNWCDPESARTAFNAAAARA